MLNWWHARIIIVHELTVVCIKGKSCIYHKRKPVKVWWMQCVFLWWKKKRKKKPWCFNRVNIFTVYSDRFMIKYSRQRKITWKVCSWNHWTCWSSVNLKYLSWKKVWLGVWAFLIRTYHIQYILIFLFWKSSDDCY